MTNQVFIGKMQWIWKSCIKLSTIITTQLNTMKLWRTTKVHDCSRATACRRDNTVQLSCYPQWIHKCVFLIADTLSQLKLQRRIHWVLLPIVLSFGQSAIPLKMASHTGVSEMECRWNVITQKTSIHAVIFFSPFNWCFKHQVLSVGFKMENK